jgi:phosphomannomutase
MDNRLALLMDIDGTLTPPREPLPKEMAEALARLAVPFHVAAGSDLPLIEPQFFRPLWEFGVRRDFEAFINNGALHCRCPYSQRYAIDVIESFDFQQHLGLENYKRLVRALEEILADPQFQLPPSLQVIGQQIVYRGSMLNFAPIGRTSGHLNQAALDNRKAFVRFDKSTQYRRRILARLTQAVASLIQEDGLRILFGGETSFDIVIDGKDKTNAVRTLLQMGLQEVVFLGDALFEGGNDSVILDYIARWKHPTPCPLRAIRVEGWEQTIQVCRENGWLL